MIQVTKHFPEAMGYVGPVGSLQTNTNGMIPVPFKYYLRAGHDSDYFWT